MAPRELRSGREGNNCTIKQAGTVRRVGAECGVQEVPGAGSTLGQEGAGSWVL